MQHLVAEFRKASFLIKRTEYNTAYLRPISGTRTHHTGLNGDIQATVAQILSTHVARSSGQCLHFGMGSHIVQPLGKVMAATDNPARSEERRVGKECGSTCKS